MALSLTFGLGFLLVGTRPTPPRLAFARRFQDLGEFVPGKHDVKITMRNVGGEALEVNKVRSTCSCAIVKKPSAVAPGESATCIVSLGVTPGPRQADMLFYTNDPSGPQRLSLLWHGSADPVFSPRQVFCGAAAWANRTSEMSRLCTRAALGPNDRTLLALSPT